MSLSEENISKHSRTTYCRKAILSSSDEDNVFQNKSPIMKQHTCSKISSGSYIGNVEDSINLSEDDSENLFSFSKNSSKGTIEDSINENEEEENSNNLLSEQSNDGKEICNTTDPLSNDSNDDKEYNDKEDESIYLSHSYSSTKSDEYEGLSYAEDSKVSMKTSLLKEFKEETKEDSLLNYFELSTNDSLIGEEIKDKNNSLKELKNIKTTKTSFLEKSKEICFEDRANLNNFKQLNKEFCDEDAKLDVSNSPLKTSSRSLDRFKDYIGDNFLNNSKKLETSLSNFNDIQNSNTEEFKPAKIISSLIENSEENLKNSYMDEDVANRTKDFGFTSPGSIKMESTPKSTSYFGVSDDEREMGHSNKEEVYSKKEKQIKSQEDSTQEGKFLSILPKNFKCNIFSSLI